MAQTDRQWVVPFFAAVVGMMALQMSSLGFSPLLPAIQKAFGMTFSQVGLFTGMYGILALIISLPAGMAAKKFGEKRVMLTGMVGIVLGLVALSRAQTFSEAFFARGLWLTGYRFAFVCVLTAVAMTCPPWLKGRSMGIVGAVSSLASVVGAPFGSTIGEALGWQHGILGFAGATVIGAAVVAMFYRSTGGATGHVGHGFAKVEPAAGDGPARSAFRTPIVWALAALVGVVGLGQFSATFFVPSAAKAIYGLDATGAALIISTGYITAIIVNLTVGYLMDRFDRWYVLAAVIFMMIPASLLMASGSLLLFRIGTALLIGCGFTSTNQIYGVAGTVLTGRETGNVMGVVSLGAGVFGYVGPQVLGGLRDLTGTFNAGWYFITVVAVLTLTETLWLRSYSRKVRS